MSKDEVTPERPKAWVWVLLIILVAFLMVPIASMALAFKKSQWVPLTRKGTDLVSKKALSEESQQQTNEFAVLRATVEKVAASAINAPKLTSKMKQVEIVTPAAAIKKASDSICRVLEQRNQQFVEAVDTDKIRIVVILKSKDWPALSGSLQMAAEKDGFLYRGPSQTTTAEQSDTVVAEIEIKRKPVSVTSKAPKSAKGN